MKATSFQSNFTSGELSPKLMGRADIARYPNAAKELENFLILSAGGGQRRPGTKYVADVKDSSLATRIIDFTFGVTQAYTIEMGNLYMRFYANNGRLVESSKTITGATKANPVQITSAAHGYSDDDWVVITGVVGMTELNGKTFIVDDATTNTFTLNDIDGANVDSTAYTTYGSGGVAKKVIEVTTPYLTAELFDVQLAQKADVLYLTHSNHAQRKLERTSATAFSLSTITFLGGPFLDDNTGTTTITPSADTGNDITLTASAALFNANHVGAYWKVKSGIVKIDTYTDTTHVVGDVQANQDGTAGDLATGPAATDDWAEGAWSADEGYPGVVSFHEQRILYAKTKNSLQSFWGSYIRVFDDFFAGTGDSDSYRYTIDTEQVNAIRWLSSGSKALQIGTFGGTFSASSGSDTVPISPTNIIVVRDTTYGSAAIIPKRIGNFIYYIQRNLKTLRELGENPESIAETQRALDITVLSDHITGDDGIVDMAYQQSPNNVLWLVRDDGEVATLTRQIDQEVIGWTRQILGGSFVSTATAQAEVESVAVIPGFTGDDQVWFIVKRTIDSTTRRYVEYLMPQTFDDQDDAFFVDSGLSLDDSKTITGATKANPVVITSAAHGFTNGDQIKIVDVIGMTELNGLFYKVKGKTDDTFQLTNTDDVNIDGTDYTTYVTGGEVREMVTAISGLEHLEGETVQVLADGAVRPDCTVSSGAITLASKAAKVHVGLGFDSVIQTLPLSEGSATGTGISKKRKIFQTAIRFLESLGCQFGRDSDNLDTLYLDLIYFRKWGAAGDPQDSAADLFTGIKIVQFPAGWDRLGEVLIKQIQPLPMMILFIITYSEVNE